MSKRAADVVCVGEGIPHSNRFLKLDSPKGIKKSHQDTLITCPEERPNRFRLLIRATDVPVPGEAEGRLPEEFLEAVLERGLGLLCRTSNESRCCLLIYLTIDPFEQCFGLCITVGHNTVGGSQKPKASTIAGRPLLDLNRNFGQRLKIRTRTKQPFADFAAKSIPASECPALTRIGRGSRVGLTFTSPPSDR